MPEQGALAEFRGGGIGGREGFGEHGWGGVQRPGKVDGGVADVDVAEVDDAGEVAVPGQDMFGTEVAVDEGVGRQRCHLSEQGGGRGAPVGGEQRQDTGGELPYQSGAFAAYLRCGRHSAPLRFRRVGGVQDAEEVSQSAPLRGGRCRERFAWDKGMPDDQRLLGHDGRHRNGQRQLRSEPRHQSRLHDQLSGDLRTAGTALDPPPGDQARLAVPSVRKGRDRGVGGHGATVDHRRAVHPRIVGCPLPPPT
ncbi:hypothetical protein SAMN05216268_104422 [Streptomyces yunnanensis]|uniref:Uncharacterized protein n=1 Tax=Streptomyces yunnanensis TaxID=156453 RepID=A0A9X8QR42_9ACTN|nr:hypothetical protein SAMN05216268_104422 [Streptomyces yunnanensis]